MADKTFDTQACLRELTACFEEKLYLTASIAFRELLSCLKKGDDEPDWFDLPEGWCLKPVKEVNHLWIVSYQHTEKFEILSAVGTTPLLAFRKLISESAAKYLPEGKTMEQIGY